MKVLIKPASAMEVQNVEVKENSLIVSPRFFQPKGRANLGIIEVRRNDGSIAFAGLLTISGKTGVVAIESRTKSVPAALDAGSKDKKTS